MTVAAVLLPAPASAPALSRRRLAGVALIGAVAAFAIVGPWLIQADPARQNLMQPLAPIGGDYLLGTDHLGRSTLARLAHASRLSLSLSLLTVFTAALAGGAAGLVAAWRGGWSERVLLGITDGILALPGLLLVLLMRALVPGSFWPVYIGLSLVLSVEYFRLVRAAAGTVLASPQVEAARLLGFDAIHIMRRHVVPEVAPLVVTLMAFGASTVVMALAALSFIGSGFAPPTAEWGGMLTELLPYNVEAPAQLLLPSGMIFVTVIGLQLLGGRDPR